MTAVTLSELHQRGVCLSHTCSIFRSGFKTHRILEFSQILHLLSNQTKPLCQNSTVDSFQQTPRNYHQIRPSVSSSYCRYHYPPLVICKGLIEKLRRFSQTNEKKPDFKVALIISLVRKYAFSVPHHHFHLSIIQVSPSLVLF